MRKASTPTICALVVQVRKLPEEKKRGKKKKTNIYGIKYITNTQLYTPQHTYNHRSVTVFHHLLTILQILTYFNPIIGLADENNARTIETRGVLEGAEVSSLKSFSMTEGRA